MDTGEARARVQAERAEIQSLLRDAEAAGQLYRQAESEPGDAAGARPLAAEGLDDAVAETLRERLAVLDRALQWLDEQAYRRLARAGQPVQGQPVSGQPVHGQPVHGQPVPGERPDTGPAAELTVDEATVRH